MRADHCAGRQPAEDFSSPGTTAQLRPVGGSASRSVGVLPPTPTAARVGAADAEGGCAGQPVLAGG